MLAVGRVTHSDEYSAAWELSKTLTGDILMGLGMLFLQFLFSALKFALAVGDLCRHCIISLGVKCMHMNATSRAYSLICGFCCITCAGEVAAAALSAD